MTETFTYALTLSPPLFPSLFSCTGPGLAIRILAPITKEGCDKLRKADKIYLEELYASGDYDKIAQAFAVLLPCKSVGVMGDCRTYEEVCVLRAVEVRVTAFFFKSLLLSFYDWGMHFDDDWMIITSLTHSLLFFFFSNTKHKLLLRT
jgi:hypothetical protein